MNSSWDGLVDTPVAARAPHAASALFIGMPDAAEKDPHLTELAQEAQEAATDYAALPLFSDRGLFR